MKRILTLVLTVVLTLSMGVFSYASGETDPHNWYCVNNSEHVIPVLDRGMSFINKYSAYYADLKAQDKGDKVIYLTFDAGYENGNVSKILDTLKKHNAPGAFFILSNLIKRNGDLVKRMEAEGHTVCNHTGNHPDMSEITDKKMFKAQLDCLADGYKELTGKEMAKIYRPPEGRFTEQNLRYAEDLGYKTVFWSFAYADWDNNKQMDPDKALDKILSHIHNGEIMLLHPTSSTNEQIMDGLLTRLEEQGYRFGHLEEIWS